MKGAVTLSKLILIFSCLYLPIQGHASYNFNDRCLNAYDNIMHLQFQAAEDSILKERIQNPKNLISVYLENYIDFFTLFIGEEEMEFKKRKKNKDQRIKQLENGDKNSPYYLYCLAETNIQWAFTRLKFHEYAAAGLELNKAYRLLRKNTILYPQFIPNKKSLGFLHVLIGTIPDQYKWATDLIGIKGSINLGTSELLEVLDSSYKHDNYKYLRDETIFLLSFLQLHVSKDKILTIKLYNQIDTIVAQQVQKSPLLLFCQADIAMHLNKTEKAIKLLENRNPADNQFPFYYLDYLLGLAKAQRMDTDASSYFQLFLDNFRGNNYIKSAYQKIGWLALIDGDREKYEAYMQKVLSEGSSVLDEDKQALMEAKSAKTPHPELLKSRLCFDGGYYSKALKPLLYNKNLKLRGKKDSLEHTYRLARIFDETNQDLKAIAYYNKTIKKGLDSPYYYGANASLKMAHIFERGDDVEKAKHYYKKCFTFKNTEYKDSIRMKAKAGLNRLE